MLPNSERQPAAVYEFGNFRLDAERQLLFANDAAQPLDITPKTVELLAFLVRRSGELVTKDQLFAALWPGLVVEENNLNQAVSTLRRVLGEKPGENRYLLTVHGRGYRFVAAVRSVAVADTTLALAASAATAPAEPARPRLWRRRSALVLAGLAALALTLGALFWRQVPRDLPPTPVAGGAIEAEHKTVAVLPFDALGPGADDAYLAPGITESIRHKLASIAGLTVIAGSSSAIFHSRGEDIVSIGRQLHARYLVTGSVQSVASRLRVNARLLDTSSRVQVWSLEFDRGIDDVFALEDEVAAGIAGKLEPGAVLTSQPYAHFGTEAYLAFLQGNALLATRKLGDNAAAEAQYLRAIRSAHDFAAAYTGLANVYLQDSELRTHWISTEAARRAEPLLDKALKLDHQLGEAYVLRAQLRDARGDQVGAEADYRKGLALNPSYGLGYQKYAEMLEGRGRNSEMRAELEKAIQVDPMAARNYYDLGRMLLSSGTTEDSGPRAESLFLKALEVDPNYYPALTRLATLHWYTGREAEAVQLGERAIAIEPRARWARWLLANYYLELRDRVGAQSVLTEQPTPVLPVQRALLCIYDGRIEPALNTLRRPVREDDNESPDADVYALAMRDSALAARQLARGRSELLKLRPDQDWPPEKDPMRLALLAQLAGALGDRADAARRANAVIEVTRQYPSYWFAYPRAVAFAVLGRPDDAIAALQEGGTHRVGIRWWYVLERETAFSPLRNDARYRKLLRDETEHLRAERTKVDALRAHGELPTRSENPGPEPGCG
ncbi:MAG: winged helix-turn-helix domain-containing protein [Steroidobacteraceae bacterium]